MSEMTRHKASQLTHNAALIGNALMAMGLSVA